MIPLLEASNTNGLPLLGSVRKVMSPNSAGQRNNRRVTFRDGIEARNDAAVLLKPAKHGLDEFAPPVFGTVKQTRQPRLWFAFHAAQRNHRLHPIPVAVPTQRFGVIDVVRQQPSAALARVTAQAGYIHLIKQWLGVSKVAGLSTQYPIIETSAARLWHRRTCGAW